MALFRYVFFDTIALILFVNDWTLKIFVRNSEPISTDSSDFCLLPELEVNGSMILFFGKNLEQLKTRNTCKVGVQMHIKHLLLKLKA